MQQPPFESMSLRIDGKPHGAAPESSLVRNGVFAFDGRDTLITLPGNEPYARVSVGELKHHFDYGPDNSRAWYEAQATFYGLWWRDGRESAPPREKLHAAVTHMRRGGAELSAPLWIRLIEEMLKKKWERRQQRSSSGMNQDTSKAMDLRPWEKEWEPVREYPLVEEMEEYFPAPAGLAGIERKRWYNVRPIGAPLCDDGTDNAAGNKGVYSLGAYENEEGTEAKDRKRRSAAWTE